MSEHELKVQPPYFDALADGTKTFEIRRNDRAFQAGDVLHLCEWLADRHAVIGGGYFTGRDLWRQVTFVYSGDPRFGGVEAGYVVLGLGDAS